MGASSQHTTDGPAFRYGRPLRRRPPWTAGGTPETPPRREPARDLGERPRGAARRRALLALPLALLALPEGRAGAAPTTVAAAEGETMSLAPANGGEVRSDAAASQGRALLVWTKATARRAVATAQPTNRVTVRARADLCEGPARMTVTLGDGAVVRWVTVGTTGWADYAVDLSAGAGQPVVAVSFANDLLTPACDRNLHVDRVTLSWADPFEGRSLYLDPENQATAWLAEGSPSPEDAALMNKIATRAQAKWFTGVEPDVRAAVNDYVTAATTGRTLPVLVAYNIYDRDCDGESDGGLPSAGAYLAWVADFAAGIGNRAAVVILEPDGLTLVDRCRVTTESERFDLLRKAVRELERRPGVAVYVDAGHARWHSAEETARRLNAAGVGTAEGFALNTANFGWTGDEVDYARRVSALVGRKHAVVDTSRNGNGTAGLDLADPTYWCNPPGRALGPVPTAATADFVVDAYLWVKRPGESDGRCNGWDVGPGDFIPEYALGLARRAA